MSDPFYSGASFFSRFLKDSGGVFNMVGDYSGTAKTTLIGGISKKEVRIGKLNIGLRFPGILRADKYGSAGVLTNGIRINIVKDGITTDITDGNNITRLSGLARFDKDIQTSDTPGDNFVGAQLSFIEMGHPLILYEGDQFEIILNDDFTDLVTQTFICQGFEGVIRG